MGGLLGGIGKLLQAPFALQGKLTRLPFDLLGLNKLGDVAAAPTELEGELVAAPFKDKQKDSVTLSQAAQT